MGGCAHLGRTLKGAGWGDIVVSPLQPQVSHPHADLLGWMNFTHSAEAASGDEAAAPEARILFVDDEPMIRAAFARAVGMRGFVVDVAASADEALALASERHYAVVATDLNMPGKGGLALIRELLPLSPRTMFVIVTGAGEIDVPMDAGFRRSIASIVSKPMRRSSGPSTPSGSASRDCRHGGGRAQRLLHSPWRTSTVRQ